MWQMRMPLWRVTSGLSLFSCVLSFLVLFYLWLLLQRHRLKHCVNEDYLWSWQLLQPLEFLVYFFNLFIFCDVFILDIFGHFLLFSLTYEFDSPNTHSTEPHLECITQALSLTWLFVSSTFTYMQTIVLEHEFQFKPLKLLQLQLITAVQTSFWTVQTCLLAFHRKYVRNRYTLQQNVTMRPQLSAFWFRAQNSLKDFIVTK